VSQAIYSSAQQWEYAWVVQRVFSPGHSLQEPETLNKAGSGGWEAVSVTYSGVTDLSGEREFLILMKRPK
jgi:hypothetical protein